MLGVEIADRIGSVSQKSAVQIVRDPPGNLEVCERELLAQRGEMALEITVGRHTTKFTRE